MIPLPGLFSHERPHRVGEKDHSVVFFPSEGPYMMVLTLRVTMFGRATVRKAPETARHSASFEAEGSVLSAFYP